MNYGGLKFKGAISISVTAFYLMIENPEKKSSFLKEIENFTKSLNSRRIFSRLVAIHVYINFSVQTVLQVEKVDKLQKKT